mgnify:CR=1 FL=1
MGIRKGRQYATTWVKRAENIYYNWNGRVGKYSKFECYVEALKRDPEYAEAWCKLGLEITGMSAGEDTDKKLAGMDLFKDEPKITNGIGKLHVVHIDAAVFCFDKAIEIEPKYVDAWYQKGSWALYWRPPELTNGIECFLEATKLDPNISRAWHDLANAYAKRMHDGDFGKALKCYDEAINKVANDKGVVVSPANLGDVFGNKADLLSKCVKQDKYF